MKKNLFPGLLALFFIASVFLPSILLAEETASSSAETIDQITESVVGSAVESIRVTANVRHRDLLVYGGSVTLIKNSVIAVNDNSGTARNIPGDSALASLQTADDLSSDFALSDLVYYSSFDSLYVNCINIAAKSENACGNWQYVVNSTYPAVGADKHILSDGDILYFYFGNPRRVTLSAPSAEASTTVIAKAESYDYVNDAWTALSGTAIGVTKPNADDPYSPLVIFSATSDSQGIASLILDAPGSYDIGLAMDYYFPSVPLSISPPIPAENEGTAGEAGATGTADAAQGTPASPASHRRETSGTSGATKTSGATEIATTPELTEKEKKQADETKEMIVKMDMNMDKFLENYKIALENQKLAGERKQKTVTATEIKKEIALEPSRNQVAGVADAIEAEKNWFKRLLTRLSNFLGFKNGI